MALQIHHRAKIIAQDLENMGPHFPILRAKQILSFTTTPEQTTALSRLLGWGTSILGADEVVVGRPSLLWITHARYVLPLDPGLYTGIILGSRKDDLSTSQQAAFEIATHRYPVLATIIMGESL